MSDVVIYLSAAWALLSGLPVFLQIPLGLCVFFAFPHAAKGLLWLVIELWEQPGIFSGWWEVASSPFRWLYRLAAKATRHD